jgi:lysophospholipase
MPNATLPAGTRTGPAVGGAGGTGAHLAQAPFHAGLADGPESGHALWLHASDGVRLRIGLWPAPGARGTVLILPGRTEYIEKYGRAARALAERGLASIALDWRGQGLADRLGPVRAVGHVEDFQHFQRDFDALMQALPGLAAPDLPMPHAFIGHSMGGAITLRALLRGAPQAAGFRAAAFTGPMWNIAMHPMKRWIARPISAAACAVGQGARFAPGTSAETYLLRSAFEGNSLTTDRHMWDYMRRQISAEPDLSLAGPSMCWLCGALAETRAFARADPPDFPVLTFLGTHESIVSQDAIRALCARWPSATLRVIEGAEHEVMMETPGIRRAIFDDMAAFFTQHSA